MTDDNDKRVDANCPDCGRMKSAAAADAQGTVTFWCRGGHKWNPLAPKLSPADNSDSIAIAGYGKNRATFPVAVQETSFGMSPVRLAGYDSFASREIKL